jgi:hypothetical protein
VLPGGTRLARRNGVQPIYDSTPPPPATAVWDLLWEELARVVDETRFVLGRHLGGLELHARRGPASAARGSAEVGVGRSTVRLELPFEPLPPMPREPLLIAVFGSMTPVLRLFCLRAGGIAPCRVLLAIEPRSGRWISVDGVFGPASLADRELLERFFLSLLVDPS